MKSSHEHIKFYTTRPGHSEKSETMAVSFDGGLYVAGEKVVTESEHRRVVSELQNTRDELLLSFVSATDDCAGVLARNAAAADGAYPLRRPTADDAYRVKQVYCSFGDGLAYRLLYQTPNAPTPKLAENPTYEEFPRSSFGWREIYVVSTQIADPNTNRFTARYRLGANAQVSSYTYTGDDPKETVGEQFRQYGCGDAANKPGDCYLFEPVPGGPGEPTNWLRLTGLYGESGWQSYSNGGNMEVYVIDNRVLF
ncbi:hypothetical protein CYMTET_36437 [Cymbomonas tetramitiformis]|uniref:Uncharacterized protein n=1 Tax=Cymbomonas tetramitiformis TaxID=36881 RepID=A0AAE0F7J3_9CHLO|nr:hypothetical protein CYMTET_36437 [Cymbomonas tetramitiformis]